MTRQLISSRPPHGQRHECGRLFGVNRRACRRPAGHRGRHSVISDVRTLWVRR